MTTATDIANRALARIGVKTPDNAVDAAILEKATDALTDLHANLFERNVLNWYLTSIPAHSVGPLVDELAWYLRDDFSIPDAKKVSLQAAQQAARADLYSFIEVKAAAESSETTYY